MIFTVSEPVAEVELGILMKRIWMAMEGVGGHVFMKGCPLTQQQPIQFQLVRVALVAWLVWRLQHPEAMAALPHSQHFRQRVDSVEITVMLQMWMLVMVGKAATLTTALAETLRGLVRRGHWHTQELPRQRQIVLRDTAVPLADLWVEGLEDLETTALITGTQIQAMTHSMDLVDVVGIWEMTASTEPMA